MDTPLVYLMLGSKGSGRRDVLRDLIEFGLAEGESVMVVESSDEAALTPDWLKTDKASIHAYQWDDKSLSVPSLGNPDSNVFFLADGLQDPADFIEGFFAWFKQSGLGLGRIFTVVDCRLVDSVSKAAVWYDCCIHFSDVVLLNRRETISNKVVNGFMDRYRKQYYPCLFEMVKKGRVKNPSLVLDTSPRRISRLFDEPERFDEDDDEEKEYLDDELVPGDPKQDPFLKRIASGRREKVLPDMANLLPE